MSGASNEVTRRIDAAPPRPRQAPRPPLEPLRLDGEPGGAEVAAVGWRRGFVSGLMTAVAIVGALAVLSLAGCAGTIEADNTPWGRAAVRTEAKPPPPIYTRSSRSTVTKPPPPAPEVEETECESGVCGVAGR